MRKHHNKGHTTSHTDTRTYHLTHRHTHIQGTALPHEAHLVAGTVLESTPSAPITGRCNNEAASVPSRQGRTASPSLLRPAEPFTSLRPASAPVPRASCIARLAADAALLRTLGVHGCCCCACGALTKPLAAAEDRTRGVVVRGDARLYGELVALVDRGEAMARSEASVTSRSGCASIGLGGGPVLVHARCVLNEMTTVRGKREV
jgi:hypothetical protein